MMILFRRQKVSQMRHFFLTVFAVCAALAQVDSGGISGVVSDGTGAVIPGVQVQVTQENTNVRTDLTTNASGFYAAPALRSERTGSRR